MKMEHEQAFALPASAARLKAADMQPIERFELTRFLEGKTRAWGIFEDRFGRIRSRFSVEMTGYWQNGAFTLDERFVYDTGEIERRTWIITPGADGAFTGTCADCEGVASGMALRDSVHTRYRFRLKMNKSTIAVDLDDWVYRLEDTVAFNRATMRKWGVKLGELSLFFMRQDNDNIVPLAPKSVA